MCASAILPLFPESARGKVHSRAGFGALVGRKLNFRLRIPLAVQQSPVEILAQHYYGGLITPRWS